jgi:hypothetical protein
MSEDARSPQINVSKISGGAGVAGALFAISSVVIFLIGIPRLRIFFPAAVVLGCIFALAFHFGRRYFPRKAPGTAWILPATKR